MLRLQEQALVVAMAMALCLMLCASTAEQPECCRKLLARLAGTRPTPWMRQHRQLGR